MDWRYGKGVEHLLCKRTAVYTHTLTEERNENPVHLRLQLSEIIYLEVSFIYCKVYRSREMSFYPYNHNPGLMYNISGIPGSSLLSFISSVKSQLNLPQVNSILIIQNFKKMNTR
jgi:hypothetical protein